MTTLRISLLVLWHVVTGVIVHAVFLLIEFWLYSRMFGDSLFLQWLKIPVVIALVLALIASGLKLRLFALTVGVVLTTLSAASLAAVRFLLIGESPAEVHEWSLPWLGGNYLIGPLIMGTALIALHFLVPVITNVETDQGAEETHGESVGKEKVHHDESG